MGRPVPFREPFSLSVAPAPRASEGALLGFQLVADDQAFSSVEAAQTFFQSKEGMAAVRAAVPQDTSDQAYKLALEAWELDPPDRYIWAERALAMDVRATDALLILAERDSAWRKRGRRFQQAARLAEEAVRERGWWPMEDTDGPSLYGQSQARPWFRAHIALARHLIEGGFGEQGRDIYKAVLERDPDDHLGVRYELAARLHADDDVTALKDLVHRFREDSLTFMAYERLWLAVVAGHGEVEEAARAARQANPHVPHVMLRPAFRRMGVYVEPGSEDDAYAYAMQALGWWMAEPEAMAALAGMDAGGGAAPATEAP